MTDGSGDGRIPKLIQVVKLSETFEGSSVGAVLKRVERTGDLLASADPEDGWNGDG
jgi:hypothetical protein